MKSSNAPSILDLEHSVVIKILGWLSGADLGRISCVSSFFSSEQPDHINRLSLVEEASRDSANKIVKDIYLGTQLLDFLDTSLNSNGGKSQIDANAAQQHKIPGDTKIGIFSSWQEALKHLERRQLAVKSKGRVAIGGDVCKEVLLIVKDGQLFVCSDFKNHSSSEILPNVRETKTLGLGLIGEGIGEKVQKVAAGLWDVMILTESDRLYSWGRSRVSQGGQLRSERKNEPVEAQAMESRQVAAVSVTALHTIALSKEGEAFCFGNAPPGSTQEASYLFPTLPVLLPTRVCQVSCGLGHSNAVTEDGRLYTWGSLDGVLTQRPERVRGVLDNHFVVQSVGGYGHTMALTATGSLVGFGWNYDGQLGLDSTKLTESEKLLGIWPPTEVSVKVHRKGCQSQHSKASRVVDLAAGSVKTAIVLEDGHLLVTRRDKNGFDCFGGGFVGVACGWQKGVVGVREDGTVELLEGLTKIPTVPGMVISRSSI